MVTSAGEHGRLRVAPRMNWRAAATVLAAVAAGGLAMPAGAQTVSPAKPSNVLTLPRATHAYYEEYRPSRRIRMRRDGCLRSEDMRGAYCVQKCDRGYHAVDEANPPLCRSQFPLPAGEGPHPVRDQVGVQPPLRRPATAAPSAPAPDAGGASRPRPSGF